MGHSASAFFYAPGSPVFGSGIGARPLHSGLRARPVAIACIYRQILGRLRQRRRHRMTRRMTVVSVALACLLARSTTAHAQSAIAGVVKDSTGAVLPGVSVEASSSALIEKVRAVVTDETGQYKIVDLRPGTYTLTVVLQGFNTVKREGIE